MHVLWNSETAWSSFHQGKCNFARSLFLPFSVPWFNLLIYVCLFCPETQPPDHWEEFHKALATFTSGIGAHWVIIETPNVISAQWNNFLRVCVSGTRILSSSPSLNCALKSCDVLAFNFKTHHHQLLPPFSYAYGDRKYANFTTYRVPQPPAQHLETHGTWFSIRSDAAAAADCLCAGVW